MASASASADPCGICLGDISRGQAVFVAECSHTFHHRCISNNVARGNHDCPLCKVTWRDLPATIDPVAPAPPRKYADDDETVVAQGVVQAQADAAGLAAHVGEMALKTYCEFPAVARDVPRDNFAVVVHVRAPDHQAGGVAADEVRAPLDLVTVLDVSGSMEGRKLALLKQAMGFVIDNLGPADRLSIVSFSTEASRKIRLTRMSSDGKASAKRAVESLVANGLTNISKGLLVASEVLADRRYRNAVASVILLSDGQDNKSGVGRNHQNLVPALFRDADNRPGPIHTFGFGADHDSVAMHTIAEVACGTFAFVENQEVVQDSFAQCIGGLLSVAVQDASLAVTCVHPGVRVREVKSGRYGNLVGEDGRAASVDVGELYADEERRFLLFLDVPRAEAAEEVTCLMKLSCTYRDTVTGRAVDVAGEDAIVQRPVEVANPEASMEVERERVRVAAAEDIAVARAAAERGEHAEAARILQRRRQSVLQSAPGRAGAFDALVEELQDFGARVEDEAEYKRTGRACMLTGISTHAQQRGTLLAVRKKGGRTLQCARKSAQPYTTRKAKKMVEKSRAQRQQEQQSSAPAPKKRKISGSSSSGGGGSESSSSSGSERSTSSSSSSDNSN